VGVPHRPDFKIKWSKFMSAVKSVLFYIQYKEVGVTKDIFLN
jgi:hypothetical protein